MNEKEFITLLNDLKKTRRLSGESTVMIKPFIGMYLSFTFILESVSSTFSQKHGTQYAKGKTVVAKIIDSELKCSVLFSPDQNDWLSTLSSGYKFTKEVLVLGLDNLHDRVIFGCSEKTQEIPKASECSTELAIDRTVPDREEIQEIGESENLHPSSLQKRRLFKRKKHVNKVFNKAQKISLKLKGGKKLRLPHLKSRLRSVTLKNSGKKTNQDGASPIPIAEKHSKLYENWMDFWMIVGGLVLLFGMYSVFMEWYNPTPCPICKSTEGYRVEGSKYDNKFFFCKSCGHKYDRHP